MREKQNARKQDVAAATDAATQKDISGFYFYDYMNFLILRFLFFRLNMGHNLKLNCFGEQQSTSLPACQPSENNQKLKELFLDSFFSF